MVLCKQCSEELFGEDYGDFKNLNRLEHTQVACAGCGMNCVVDFTGTCVSSTCLKRHGLQSGEGDDTAMQENEILKWHDELTSYPG